MQDKTRDRHPPKRRNKRRRKPPRQDRNAPQDASQQVLARTSSIETEHADAITPMSPDEIREMKEHLQFLFKHRKRLQLKVNAKEDLLLNGAKEPSERGVCIHLLRKVDRNCVEKALRRTEVADIRIQLLQGVIRFSSDINLLILYLESLRETQSREKAAAALSLGLKRIDFAKASKAQMARVFDLIATLFPQPSLPPLLFGFWQSPSFREAFDQSTDRLPEVLARLLMPIRALFTAVVEGQEPDDREVLRTGLALFLPCTLHLLKDFPETTRRRLFVLELALTKTPTDSDPILQALLDTVPPKDRLFSTLALDWVRQLLERHEDQKAEKLLSRLAEHHPRFEIPKRWLQSLQRERVGRIALKNTDKNRTVQHGFWLDRQQEVVVRIGTAAESVRYGEMSRMHQSLHIPGVAPFATQGVAEDGRPYIATATVGQPATKHYQKRPPVHVVIEHLQEGLRLLWSLSQTGIAVSDFGLESCFVDARDRLWLQDLSQCTQAAPGEAAAQTLDAARRWCATQLEQIGPRRRRLFSREKLQEVRDWEALMAWSQRLV